MSESPLESINSINPINNINDKIKIGSFRPIEDYNLRFMTPFKRSELRYIDSTTLMEYKNCPRKYFYKYVLGFKMNDNPPYFTLGSSYHKFREDYELEYMINKDHPTSFLKGFESAIAYWDKHYDKKIDPKNKFYWLNKDVLINSVKTAATHLKNEKAKNTYTVLSVEQPFCVEIIPGLYRAGRSDQIVKWMGKLWGKDFKTASTNPAYYLNSVDPNEQFSGYTYAESLLAFGTISERERIQGQIVEVLFNSHTKTNGLKTEIQTFSANRNLFQLNEWKNDFIAYSETIQRSRETDNWPKNEKQCGFCEFRRVCNAPSESAQMTELKRNFTVKIWDPLHPDGES